MYIKLKKPLPYLDHSQTTINFAVLLTLGAALIHFAVVPQHLQEYLPFGLFFLVVGLAQVALAIGIFIASSRRLLVAALVTTVVLIAIWVLSRTAGVPIGPDPWQPEEMGIVDEICIALEGISALVFLRLLFRPWRPGIRRLGRVIAGTMPLLVLIGLLTAIGMTAAANAMPVAFNAGSLSPGNHQPLLPALSSLLVQSQPRPLRSQRRRNRWM